MKDLEQYRDALPYKESPAYIHDLIRQSRDRALAARPSSRPAPWIWVAVAATVAIILMAGIALIPRKSPIDRFLAGISDEEAAMIVNYDMEDIPE